MNEKSNTMIGLSENGHSKLKILKEDGIFHEMVDGYRAGVAFAIASNESPVPISGKKQTTFSVGTVDRKLAVSTLVQTLLDVDDSEVYAIIEQHAEIGVQKFYHEYEEPGNFDFIQMLKIFESPSQ